MTAREIQINNFIGNFAAATVTALEDAGLDKRIFSVPQGNNQSGAFSGEVIFSLGEPINEGQRQSDGAIVYDAYNGTLMIRLRCQRTYDGPGLTSGVLTRLGEMAAKISQVMTIQVGQAGATIYSPFNLDNLPYYSVKFCRPQAVTPYSDYDFGMDVLEMTWAVQFSILPNAWA